MEDAAGTDADVIKRLIGSLASALVNSVMSFRGLRRVTFHVPHLLLASLF